MTPLEVILLLAAGGLAIATLSFRRAYHAGNARHEKELAAERERFAGELRIEEERTARLFDRMVEGVIVIGSDSRIRLANRAATDLFELKSPAAGRTVLETIRNHEIAAVVSRLETESEVLNHELRLDGGSGTRFIAVNAVALRAADGIRYGSLVVFHDLTRIRQLEAMRQEFVANVSHELRTPLSLIKSAAETLIDGGRNDPAVTSRFLEIIEKHASRLGRLIDDLLLLARLDSDRIELELRSIDLREFSQEVLEDEKAAAAARNVSLSNEVPPDLRLRVDPDRFRQVICNLVENAIKHGRASGSVWISAKASAAAVEISVRDDGPGIAPAHQARIFERFYRADKARSREQGGTGLGLAIVKNVVLAHGGDVQVRSEPGKGTEFILTIPT